MRADLAAAYRGRTVAVTGATGYVGSALLDALQGSGARVVAAGRAPLTDLAGVDVVFHLAGNTSVYRAARDPEASFRSTVGPIAGMVAAAQSAGCRPRIVYASTATVYGLTDTLPVAEDRAPQPATVYDLHKLWAEEQLAMASRQGHVDAVALRLANVYGPSPGRHRAGERGFLNQAVERALQGADLCLYGDGTYLRDFVHIDDVVRAFLLVGVGAGGGSRCLNVASGRGIPMREALAMVADRVGRATGRPVAVREVGWPAGAEPIERRSFAASVDRLAAEYQWRPTIALGDGIDTLVRRRAGGDRAVDTLSPPAGPIRLNLGCGGRPLPGYVNIDRDGIAIIRDRYPDRHIDAGIQVFPYDLFNLPFADASVEEVRADSLLEHLAFADERRFFEEVTRVVKPGGLVYLSTVDFEAAARQWLAATDDWRDFYRTDADAIRRGHWFGTYSPAPDNRWGYLTATLFGNQNGDGQFHRNCYSEAKLRAICARVALDVERIDRFQWQGDRDHMLAVTARKRG